MKKYLLFAAVLLSITACNKDWVVAYEPQYSDDFVEVRNVFGSDTIILDCQGGPIRTLMLDNIRNYVSEIYPNYSFAGVHQGQTKDSTVLDKFYFNTTDGKRINDESADMLSRSIKHFKDKKKFVVVMGFSYGNWVVLRNLAKHGVVADRYIVGGGRLDIDMAQVDVLLSRKWVEFVGGKAVKGEKYLAPKEDWAALQLANEMFKDRYTDKLKGLDLKKLMFYTHQDDDRVGAVTPAEVSFMKSKNATVLVSETGGHDMTIPDYYAIMTFIRKKI